MGIAKLVLNGEIDKTWLYHALSEESDVYCTDGAFNILSELGIRPEKVLGDMDSIDDNLRYAVQSVILPNQDYTDFEKAIIYLKHSYKSLKIYGASGGETDHFLGNLSVAKKYCDAIDLQFHDPLQYYFFAKKKTKLNDIKDKNISIIPFPMMKSVSSSGLKYPLLNQNLFLGGAISVRNLAIRDKVTITYEEGSGVIVVQR